MAFDLAAEIAEAQKPQQSGLTSFDLGAELGLKKPRTTMQELGTGLRTGFTEGVPQMVGQAMQWAGYPGGTIYETGKGLADSAKERALLPENTLQPEQHGDIVNALAEGGQMLGRSVTIPAAAALGLAATAVAAPELAVGGLASLGLSALAGAVPAGMSQAQETFERVKEVGKSDAEAKAAGWKTGTIEAGGEFAGTYLGGKFVGVGGKVLGKLFDKVAAPTIGKVLTEAADSAILKPFAKSLVTTAAGEVGTEVGQAYTQGLVEKAAGVEVDPLQQAKDVVGPTLGMTAWLAPFGLHANYRGAKRAEAVDQVLSNGSIPAEQRKEVVTALYEKAKESKVPDAEEWYKGALQDVEAGIDVRRTSVVEATDPRIDSIQRQALAKATGGEVEIIDGVATITSGDNTITAPVEALTRHFTEGKTLDTFDTAAATAPKLNEVRTAVQDDNDPFTFDTLVAMSKDPEALKQAGLNRRDVEALVEAEIERGEIPEAAWIKQERAAQQTNQEIKDRIQGITSRVANAERNQFMDEQVRQYEQTGLQVPPAAPTVTIEGQTGQGMPVTEQSSVLSQQPEWSSRYADLLDVFGDDRTARLSQERSTTAQPAITRLTDLEQKAQGLPGVATPTSLSPQEEQEYVMLRTQVSPVDAQRMQEYQANVARRDALALKQSGAQAFETVGEGGTAVINQGATPQTLTPKEQADLAQLTEVTRQPPVSPYVDDSRTLAAGLPAAQSETLFSQRPPWETGPVQDKETVTAVAQQVSPGIRYDGAMLDLHQFTHTNAAGQEATFSVKGEVTPQTVHAALNTSEAKFGLPLTPAPPAALMAQGATPTEPINAPALRARLDESLGKGTAQRLIRQGKLQIVATAAEIPGIGQMSIGQQMRAQGVYRSKEGKIYLVADNLSKSTVTGVFKHEVVHALLRQDATFMARREALLKDFAELLGRDASVDAAAAKVPAGTQEQVRTEEALAYWVQDEANHKHSLFRRIVAAVKAALKRLGIPTTSMTPADFSRLFAQGTEAFVNEGAPKMAGADGTLYSQEEIIKNAKAFFSKLMRVGQTKFEGMKAQSVEPFLLKQGVKKAEIEATGLREWLAGMKPTDKVTKEQLKDFVKANTVEFEDVVLDNGHSKKKELVDAYDAKMAEKYGRFTWYSVATKGEQAEFTRLNTEYDNEVIKGTHFDQYTEPGAKEGSYREMFVTAPVASRQTGNAKTIELYNMGIINQAEAKKQGATVIDKWQDGHSQYSDIQNPIVRIRFNEVAGPNGERILRVEEMQGPSADNQAKMPKHLKENIYQTGVKRILAYAKENGFDGVALATKPGRTAGETQADRYSLEKQVDSIDVINTGDGTYTINAEKDGRLTASESVTKEKLPSVIGKDLAERAIKESQIGSTPTYRGVDLSIGGTGLKQLYDVDLPNIFKAWGGERMGEIAVDDKRVTVNPLSGYYTRGPGSPEFRTEAEAAAWEGTAGDGTTMPYIPITDRTADEFPLFSQATASHAAARRSTAASLKEMAKDKLTEASPFLLRVSPLRTLVQTLGSKISQINKISEAFDEMNHVNTAMVEDAKGNYDAHKELNKKATGNNDKFNTAATLSTFYRMTPWKNLDEQEWVPTTGTREELLMTAEKKWKAAGMDKSTGKTFIAAWTEASKAYREIGSKEAQDQYRKMARHMRHIRQREETNVLATIESATVGNPKLRAEMMERFNATFKNITGTYWPLTRDGEYILQYKDADGLPVVEHFQSAQARTQARKMLEQGGATEVQQGYASKAPRGQVSIPGELMQQFSQAIIAEKTKGLDPEQDAAAYQSAAKGAQDTINDLNQIWLRWQPETAALKNAIQRRNIKGYDLNAGRAYLEYVQRHAQSIAWTEQGKVIEGHLKDLQDKVKEDRKAGKNVDLPQMVLNDLRERVQAARDSHVGPIASFVGKLGTAMYMTSPSIALVQMTQLPMLTLPKLGVMYNSPGRAAKALMSGIRQAFSKKFNREAMFGDEKVNALFDMTRFVVTEENKNEPGAAGKALGQRVHDDAKIAELFGRLSKDQQKLFILRESLARNLLDISATHEAYAIAQGKDPDSAWRKVFDLAMAPMRISEQASRKAAILATMEMAQAQGKDVNKIMSDVSEVVNDTLYSYDKTNKPTFLQGSTGRVLAMFQWYRIMTMFRMALLFKRSIAAETPEIKAAARKEFIGIMGMAGVLAGTLGMPMAGLIFAAMDAASDDDEPRDSALEWRNFLQEQFGERLGNIAAYGLPAAMGMHMTKRVGMGDMFGMQSQPPPNVYGKDLAAWWAANQIGPAFSIGQGFVQGYDEMVNKGNVIGGMEAVLPKPLKDMMKAYRLWDEGELKSAGGKRVLGPDQITPDMIPLIALGFNPLEAAKMNEANYSRSKLGAQMSRRRGRMLDDIANALQGDGDIDGAYEALADFNRKNPAFTIRGGEIRSAIKRNIKTGLGLPSKRERMLNTVYEIPATE